LTGVPGALITGAIGGLIGGVAGFLAGQQLGGAAYDVGEDIVSDDGAGQGDAPEAPPDPGGFFGVF
jgi:hypothetical protein